MDVPYRNVLALPVSIVLRGGSLLVRVMLASGDRILALRVRCYVK